MATDIREGLARPSGAVRGGVQDGLMRLTGTSTQRTYRYVRLGIVGAVVLLVAALIAVTTTDGAVTSLSALYYTPGRVVFVGALFAISLGLLALSGHSLEQALLDLAALFAPVIAIVPTPAVSGDAPGLVVDCAGGGPCVPSTEYASIQTGMWCLVVVGALGLVVAVVVAFVQRTMSRGLSISLAVAAIVVVAGGVWAAVAPASFVALGHLVATGAFFGLMAVVSAVSAIEATARWRVFYTSIAVGIAVVLVLLLAVMALRLAGVDLVAASGVPLVLVGELLVIALFAAYWIGQTVQKWDDPNPSLIAEPIR
jgi:hypothetical protein